MYVKTQKLIIVEPTNKNVEDYITLDPGIACLIKTIISLYIMNFGPQFIIAEHKIFHDLPTWLCKRNMLVYFIYLHVYS